MFVIICRTGVLLCSGVACDEQRLAWKAAAPAVPVVASVGTHDGYFGGADGIRRCAEDQRTSGAVGEGCAGGRRGTASEEEERRAVALPRLQQVHLKDRN